MAAVLVALLVALYLNQQALTKSQDHHLNLVLLAASGVSIAALLGLFGFSFAVLRRQIDTSERVEAALGAAHDFHLKLLENAPALI